MGATLARPAGSRPRWGGPFRDPRPPAPARQAPGRLPVAPRARALYPGRDAAGGDGWDGGRGEDPAAEGGEVVLAGPSRGRDRSLFDLARTLGTSVTLLHFGLIRHLPKALA